MRRSDLDVTTLWSSIQGEDEVHQKSLLDQFGFLSLSIGQIIVTHRQVFPRLISTFCATLISREDRISEEIPGTR